MSIIDEALRRLNVTGQVPSIPRPIPSPLGTIRKISPRGETNDGRATKAAPLQVVHLDRAALAEAGFLPPVENQRQMADQFRHAKRPLLAAALGRGVEPVTDGYMIMVTSSLPNEGKTFVSFNLAVSMSLERDISVVLVDADVAKRHVSQILGIDREPGLLDAVQDENLDVESLVLATSFPKLAVVSAGSAAEIATELLASHRMEAVVAKLGVGAERQRVVIFDSPPLLLTSESRALARHVGQIVLVVRAAMTPRQVVQDAINCLDGVRPVSLLLNQSRSAVEAGYYYHGGAYGQYRHGAATPPPDDAK